MAFTSSITSGTKIFGSMQKSWGTFTNTGGSTGGDINTGLKTVESMNLTHTGSSVVASAPVINEDLSSPIVGTAVTIVTVADADGIWEAIGKVD